MKVLIIDNYDSFTFNLYQLTGEVLHEEFSNEINDIIVKRNDEVSLSEIKKNNFDKIIISPGPGSPVDDSYFGICREVIKELGNENIPILGICLGMQGIVHVLGGEIIHAKSPMHGKSSFLIHNEEGIHAEIPQRIEIMRYHSLIVDCLKLPKSLKITAFCKNEDSYFTLKDFNPNEDEIMAVEHESKPIFGIQYHPESFATEGGKKIILNFLKLT